MSIEALSDVVATIREYADEIRSQESRTDLDYGQLLAYAEALTVIRDACDPELWQEIGLDFDIDAKYL